jgi:hypothetical protein
LLTTSLLQLEGCDAGKHLPLTLLSPNLDTVEITHDNGYWPTSIDKLSNAHVKKLYLHDSHSTPGQVADALACFPNLEVLYVTPFWNDDNISQEDHVMVTPLMLEDALEKYGRNIKHLDLGWYDARACRASIGFEGRITCLPKLPQLEVLCLQFSLLFENEVQRNTEEDPQLRLSELLPASLEVLTLEDWWWNEAPQPGLAAATEGPLSWGNHAVYRVAVLDMFTDLADNASMFTRLRQVTFLTRMPHTWWCDYSVTADESLAVVTRRVKQAFEAKGIQFTAYEI